MAENVTAEEIAELIEFVQDGRGSWPDEIGLVTYSKTPLSRVSQKARKP
jgi:hypothetical protein